MCRCCDRARESLQHFTACCFSGEVFADLRELTGFNPCTDQERERYDLFLIRPDRREPEGWVNLHLLLWKQVVAALVRVDTEDEQFASHNVWFATWKRYKKRALALQEKNRTVYLRKLGRGENPPDFSEKGKALTPLARFSEEGTLIWDDDLCASITALTKKK